MFNYLNKSNHLYSSWTLFFGAINPEVTNKKEYCLGESHRGSKRGRDSGQEKN